MHIAESQVELFLQKVMNGQANMTDEVIDMVASDVKAALNKQFNSGPRNDFRIRMSNIGRPKCQLWMEKNHPESRTPPPPTFLMNMVLGDLVEAVFKGLLRSAGVDFKDNADVALTLSNGEVVKGEYDLELDGAIDDIKSASPYAYDKKFDSFETVQAKDHFGYVAQLVGYAAATNKKVGGWWVINKANGAFKYVEAEPNSEAVLKEMSETVDYIQNDEPFERCFEPVEETFYRKPTGNMVLHDACKWCNFKDKCWPDLKVVPQRPSRSSNPPLREYVSLAEEAP